MHLLSFIGTGNYSPTIYALDDRQSPPTSYPQIALAKLLPDCTGVTVFETTEAHAKHREVLQSEADAGGIDMDFVTIPSGTAESEHWDIFTLIEKEAHRHDEVALDVTHGFRTLPMLGLLSAIFLRATERVLFSRLLYGAFEARCGEPEVTPVFDLTSFLVLIDWLTASHVFLKTGNAAELSTLLKSKHRELWAQGTLTKDELPKALGKMGSSLETAADSLLLLRRHQRERAIESLQLQVEKAHSEIPTFAKPFNSILDRVKESFAGVVTDTPLETEKRQIGWLIERGHTDAALTLSREWMVSWAALLLGETQIPANYDERKPFEQFLNVVGGHEHVSREDIRPDLKPALLGNQWSDSGKLWDRLRQARNDINHAGYGHDPADAGALKRKAEDIIREVLTLNAKSVSP